MSACPLAWVRKDAARAHSLINSQRPLRGPQAGLEEELRMEITGVKDCLEDFLEEVFERLQDGSIGCSPVKRGGAGDTAPSSRCFSPYTCAV